MTLVEPRPRSAVHRVSYCGVTHTKFSGESKRGGPRLRETPYFLNVAFGQFNNGVLGTVLIRPVANSVGLILRWRCPTQISTEIMNWDSVIMSRLMIGRGGWAVKRAAHQDGHVLHPWRAAITRAKTDHRVSFGEARPQNCARRNNDPPRAVPLVKSCIVSTPPNPAETTDFVVRKLGDYAPFFGYKGTSHWLGSIERWSGIARSAATDARFRLLYHRGAVELRKNVR